MTEAVEKKWIASFWGRIAALIIDILLLGFVGFCLGLVLENVFVGMGGWARLAGFVISLIYFGLMNSQLANGQTIGKRVLKIRVVDVDNKSISIQKSFLRYTIFGIPFYLNNAQFSNELLMSYLLYPLSLLIFGGILSIIYLYVFNRLTRQSLHDLVVGTYVVNCDVEQQATAEVWRVHYGIVSVICIAALVVPAFTTQLMDEQPFKDMLVAQQALMQDSNVTHASVFISTASFGSGTKDGESEQSYVSVEVVVSSFVIHDNDYARQLANTVVKQYHESKQAEIISITLSHGYDLGIWSKWSSHTHQFYTDEFN